MCRRTGGQVRERDTAGWGGGPCAGHVGSVGSNRVSASRRRMTSPAVELGSRSGLAGWRVGGLAVAAVVTAMEEWQRGAGTRWMALHAAIGLGSFVWAQVDARHSQSPYSPHARSLPSPLPLCPALCPLDIARTPYRSLRASPDAARAPMHVCMLRRPIVLPMGPRIPLEPHQSCPDRRLLLLLLGGLLAAPRPVQATLLPRPRYQLISSRRRTGLAPLPKLTAHIAQAHAHASPPPSSPVARRPSDGPKVTAPLTAGRRRKKRRRKVAFSKTRPAPLQRRNHAAPNHHDMGCGPP